MEKVLGIAHVSIIESFRRKDPYVVIILAALIIFGAGLFSRFGTEGLGKFVKDIGFSVTGILSVLVCVVAAARQLPHEIENRTLYPLLAKPVSRFQVFMGKYIGVGTMATAVVILFFAELYVVFKALGVPVSVVFFQAMLLRIMAMWIIAGLTLCLSVFLTQGANVRISLLLALAMSTFANTLLTIRTEVEGLTLRFVEFLYWILPHMELFDLTKREVHGWPAAPLWVLGALILYGAIYSAVFMSVGIYRFRTQNL